jgi:hypothetical protein
MAAVQPPPIQRLPAVLNDVINRPVQPANPPTDNDVWRATSHELQVINAYSTYEFFALSTVLLIWTYSHSAE